MKTLAILLALTQLFLSCTTATSVYYQPNSNTQALDDLNHGQNIRIITKTGRKFLMQFIAVYDNSVYGYVYQQRNVHQQKNVQARKIKIRIDIADVYYVEKLKLDAVKSVAFAAMVVLYVVSFGKTFLLEQE